MATVTSLQAFFFNLTEEGWTGKLDWINLFLNMKPKYVAKTVSQLYSSCSPTFPPLFFSLSTPSLKHAGTFQENLLNEVP